MRLKGFIVGCPRSGTTLLATIIDRHSAVCVPPETNFGVFVDKNADLRSQGGLRPSTHDEFFARLKEAPRFIDLGIPHERFLTVFKLGEASFQNAFDSMLSVYTQESKKQFCVEKTPQHLHFVSTLNEWYPNARFIHVIRDGRDVALSLRKVKFGQILLKNGCLSWKQSIAKAKEFKRQLGERWLDIRMEDLISDPIGTVQQAMKFLELPFEPHQLSTDTPTRVFREWEGDWKAESQKPINPEKIAIFRKEATAPEIRLMDMIMRKELAQLDYPPSGVPDAPLLDRFMLRAYVTTFLLANTPLAIRIRSILRGLPAERNLTP
jgi:hypothetical protein